MYEFVLYNIFFIIFYLYFIFMVTFCLFEKWLLFYSTFLVPSRYNWNIVESGVKHHKTFSIYRFLKIIMVKQHLLDLMIVGGQFSVQIILSNSNVYDNL
jgi:hypothetical protein